MDGLCMHGWMAISMHASSANVNSCFYSSSNENLIIIQAAMKQQPRKVLLIGLGIPKFSENNGYGFGNIYMFSFFLRCSLFW